MAETRAGDRDLHNTAPGKIFISYRRADNPGYSGRLSDDLSKKFGAERVFRDIEDLAPGTRFLAAIERGLAAASVLVTVIGDKWLNVKDEHGRRRLDDPNDVVVMEISVALRKGLRIIPVLLERAIMPRPEDLPEAIRELAGIQSFAVSESRWAYDVDRLIQRIDALLREIGPGVFHERIGPYRILDRLGEGGMGEVWLAEQTEPVRRKVALKLIKRGMDTRQVLARFDAERQALAVMDHTNIAQVFDGGATEDGRPYFVMELVRGAAIDSYCDEHKLSLRERLGLFIQVCKAVQHAHHKGVIHRDLKPSNILVTQQAGVPVPKVIDFGVAKATGGSLTDKTLYTTTDQLIGTPEFMSPEQAALTARDVDARTDIYSLGVILYHLLVGVLPFDAETFRNASLAEVQRKIREDEPSRPSARLTGEKNVAADVAGLRRTDPGTLGKQLKGDLDWIVMRALEKDRTRRYETANGLAQDLRRYLANEPVEARPPSRSYRAAKFVRRNRLMVVMATALMLAMILGIAGTGLGFVRERAEARKARAVTKMLTEMLSKVDPNVAKGNDITVRMVLDATAETIDEDLKGEPGVEAEVRATIGTMYYELGLNEAAEPHLVRALELRRRSLGSENELTRNLLNRLAMNHYQQQRFAETAELWEELSETLTAQLGAEHERTLTMKQNLAATYKKLGRIDEAGRLYEEVLEGRRRVLGTDNEFTTATMNGLANVYKTSNRPKLAEPLLVEALQIRRRMLGNENPRTLVSVYSLGNLYMQQQDFVPAEPLLREAFTGFEKIYKNDNHRHTLFALDALARTVLELGQLDEAEELADRSLQLHRQRYAADHQQTVSAGRLLASVYEAKGRASAAAELRRQFGSDPDS